MKPVALLVMLLAVAGHGVSAENTSSDVATMLMSSGTMSASSETVAGVAEKTRSLREGDADAAGATEERMHKHPNNAVRRSGQIMDNHFSLNTRDSQKSFIDEDTMIFRTRLDKILANRKKTAPSLKNLKEMYQDGHVNDQVTFADYVGQKIKTYKHLYDTVVAQPDLDAKTWEELLSTIGYKLTNLVKPSHSLADTCGGRKTFSQHASDGAYRRAHAQTYRYTKPHGVLTASATWWALHAPSSFGMLSAHANM